MIIVQFTCKQITVIQLGRKIDGQIKRYIDRETDRETDIETYIETDRETDEYANRYMGHRNKLLGIYR